MNAPHRDPLSARCLITALLLAALAAILATPAYGWDEVSDRRISFRFGAETLKIPYYRNHELGDPPAGITRAVIMVHGTSRNADDYYDALVTSAEIAGAEGYSLLLAPQFLTEADIDSFSLGDDVLYWKNWWTYTTSENDSCWKYGGLSQSTTAHSRPHKISSFAVMDTILYRLALLNTELDTVVIAGHSAGGMFTHRYAAGNRMEQTLNAWGIEVKYVVANPSSYVYLDGQRRIPGTVDEFQIPTSTADDPDYDSWYNRYPYGLGDLNRDQYMNNVGATQIRAQFPQRHITYLLGELDVLSANLDDAAPAMMEGRHRRERGRIYYNYLIHKGWNAFGDRRQAFIQGSGHDKDDMYNSVCGVFALFAYNEGCLFNPITVAAGQTTYLIQDALDDAVQGMTVLLEDGTYTGHRNSSPVYGKALTIRSESLDPASCIIDCQNAGIGFEFHYGEDYATVLRGVTIRNGYTTNNGAGILCMDASPAIRDCIIEDCDAGSWGGGIACMYSASPTIERCTVHNNYALEGGGIYCREFSRPTIRRTIISDSRFGAGIASDASSTPAEISCTDIHGNLGGDWTSNIQSFQGVSGNIGADPLYCGAPTDLQLCDDSPCLAVSGDCAPQMGGLAADCDSCGSYVCCLHGDCTVHSSWAGCDALGGIWHPEWSGCDPNPCPPGEGACCQASAVCQIMSEADCAAASGSYQGHDTACSPNPCPAVCCNDGACELLAEADCVTPGVWYSQWSTCTGAPCALAACCVDTVCTILIEQECLDLGGRWLYMQPLCTPNPCNSAVCCQGQACNLYSEADCISYGGTWFGDLTTCADSPCWEAVCCYDDETCDETWEMICDGVWVADSIFCDSDPCELGVCCSGQGCTITIRHECLIAGGTWYPEWDSCDPNPCRLRACCNGGYCGVTLESDCADFWMEGEETCDPNPCVAGCCIVGVCSELTEAECETAAGIWHPGFISCEPNDPCPAVCCYGAGSCDVVTAQTCASWDGTRHPEGLSCDPNPCFHIVYPDTTGGRPTLQAVIESIAPPGTNEAIGLKSGVFDVAIHQGNEPGGVDYKGRQITILSLSGDPADCVIDCSGGVRGFAFQSGEGFLSKLQGVTIRNGNAPNGGGIYCDGASPSLSNCVVRESQATGNGGGMYLQNSSYPSMFDCWFLDNTAGTDGGGVYGGTNSGVWMQGCVFAGNTAANCGGGVCSGVTSVASEANGCTFYGNSAAEGGGLYFDPSSGSAQLQRALIAMNAGGGGIMCFGTSIPSLWCCDIYGNVGGDWNGFFYSQYGTSANIWEHPQFCDPPDALTLSMNSPCVDMMSPCGQQIGALGIGCGMVSDDADDLSAGVLITHHPPGLQYTGGTPSGGWGQHYSDNWQLPACEDQNPRIDDDGSTCLIWYVLAAWPEEKRCCGGEFGLGPYDPALFGILDHGPGYPAVTTQTPTAGWPGPDEGVAVFSGEMGAHYGNYVPIYWFAGYTGGAGSGQIPLVPNPATSRAGTYGCDSGGGFFDASCLGVLGINTEGVACCPAPPPDHAVCCVAGDCMITTVSECTGLGGAWHAAWASCLPNPCPAVCCMGEGCVLATSAECAGLGGTWYEHEATCTPNPCLEPDHWADHDVGNLRVSMTDAGSVGYLDGTRSAGSGLVYPIDGANRLWIGGLWVSGGSDYVANRDYGDDPNQEWTVSLDPPGFVTVTEPGTSHQDIHAAFTDSAAVVPRGWTVEQESWAYAVNTNADDFIIVRYRVENEGVIPQPELYAGLFLDLDIEGPYSDLGGVDSTRDLVYMNDDSARVYLGIRVLRESGDPPVGNLSLIRNSHFVWPNGGYILDADKYAFLSGADSAHVMTSTSVSTDYGVVAAVGPFPLYPSEDELVCFAIVGGESLRELQAHADAAQLVFASGFAEVEEETAEQIAAPNTRLRPARPNPFGARTAIRFELSQAGPIRLAVYDVGGRCLRTLACGEHPAGLYTVIWDGRDEHRRAVAGGVYFLHLTAGEVRENRQVVLLR
ncbi:MAG: right-handed parallel beta-helix repeat-containing protein [Candidatus Eisenbacteria sp.]|nr:right-handed parallel beta-helix repeat-containing protein [Candidatus Eisenbacteria bacterium]